MNGPSLLALAFVLLALGCLLTGLVFGVFLHLGEPAEALAALEQTAPAGRVPVAPLLEEVLATIPVLFWFALFVTFTVPAGLFAGASLTIWWFLCRPRLRQERELADQEPRREAALQELIAESLDASLGEDTGPRGTRAGAGSFGPLAHLDADRRRRFQTFLRETGLQGACGEAPVGADVPPPGSLRQRIILARIAAIALAGLSLMAFLYGVAGALFFEEAASLAGLPTLPHEGTVMLLFLWMLGFLGLFAAGGVTLLSRLDRRLERRWTEARAGARDRLLGGLRRDLERLRRAGGPPEGGTPGALLRGVLLAALDGLDGPSKRAALDTARESGLPAAALDLGGADLSGSDLSGLDLFGAGLHGARLWRASFRGTDLSEADLAGADLRAAELQQARLAGASLRQANLHLAKLQGATLRGADLTAVNLDGANLWNADLSGADLAGARVHPDQLRAAASLAGATGPDGRSPAAAAAAQATGS